MTMRVYQQPDVISDAANYMPRRPATKNASSASLIGTSSVVTRATYYFVDYSAAQDNKLVSNNICVGEKTEALPKPKSLNGKLLACVGATLIAAGLAISVKNIEVGGLVGVPGILLLALAKSSEN